MAENTEQAKKQELTQEEAKEQLKRVSEDLRNLAATRAACEQILKNKNIKIVDLADETDDPLSITLSGNAVESVIMPLYRGVNANREQLINAKEQLLNIVSPVE